MPQVTITHADSSTETIPEAVDSGGWNYKHYRKIGEMKKLQVNVARSDAQSVTLNELSDKITLAGVGSGRLADVKKDGAVWTLVAYGFDIDATDEPPLPGGDQRTGTDASIVTGLVGEIPSWSAGTINAQTGSVSFVANHAFADEALRRFEASVPGELRFNDDESVDYVAALGSDKTASVTLSPANGNIEGELRVKDWGRELDATHVRVIGAHEGEAQVFANLVPSGDSGNYSNEVTYSTPRWSDSSDTKWARMSNKDISNQDAIDAEASALADELTTGHVETQPVAVVGETLSVGDWVHVEKSEVGLDLDMRIRRITTIGRGATEVDEVELSTRTKARRSEGELEETAEQFYTSFQGTSVVVQGGGGWQSADSDSNATESFRYPETEFDNGVELEVKVRPYREDSKSSGVVEHSSEIASSGELIINGSSVATMSFTSSTEGVVGVRGFFNTGAWNDIEVSVDSLTDIKISPYIEAYKKIGTQ